MHGDIGGRPEDVPRVLMCAVQMKRMLRGMSGSMKRWSLGFGQSSLCELQLVNVQLPGRTSAKIFIVDYVRHWWWMLHDWESSHSFGRY